MPPYRPAPYRPQQYRPPQPYRPMQPYRPQPYAPAPQPFVPVPVPVSQPAPAPATATTKGEKPVLDYLMKHPIAPLAGALLLVGSMLADEPAPPTLPAGLPEATAKQWQMIYTQNLERFRRRMSVFETVGKVLLGYAET